MALIYQNKFPDKLQHSTIKYHCNTTQQQKNFRFRAGISNKKGCFIRPEECHLTSSHLDLGRRLKYQLKPEKGCGYEPANTGYKTKQTAFVMSKQYFIY